jgi:hypothetical protein
MNGFDPTTHGSVSTPAHPDLGDPTWAHDIRPVPGEAQAVPTSSDEPVAPGVDATSGREVTVGSRDQLLAAARAHQVSPGVLRALEEMAEDQRWPLLATLWPVVRPSRGPSPGEN